MDSFYNHSMSIELIWPFLFFLVTVGFALFELDKEKHPERYKKDHKYDEDDYPE